MDAFDRSFDHKYQNSLLTEGDVDVRDSMIKDVVKAGSVPTGEMRKIESALLSNNPKTAAVAARVVSDLAAMGDGAAAHSFDDDVLARVARFEAITDGSAESDEAAIAIINKNDALAQSNDKTVDISSSSMLKYINSDDGADVILDVLDQLDLKDKVFKTDAEEELPAAFLASLRSAAVDLSLSSPERSKESIVRGVTERLNRTRWGTVEMFGREVFMQDAPSLTKNGKAIYGERKNFQGKQIERAVESQINSVIKSKNMEPEVARAFSRNVEETLRIVPTKVDGKTVYTPSYRPEGGGCLLYTSPSPRDGLLSRMPSSA